ncbi:MAG: hypothetical protein Q4E86_04945 [Lachnospiraceae bacterium]|nr:hypothetical protein [Lachnospiraceae bacterium]
MNIGMYLIMIIYVIIGGVSTIFATAGIIGTIAWKIYRKVTLGIPLTC